MTRTSMRGWMAGCALALGLLTTTAALPGPDQLLPSETVGFVTIPDWDTGLANGKGSLYGQLLADPSLKPFLDKFQNKFQESFLKPLETQLGIKFADYKELVH